jgi:hypothetical protein
MNRLLELRPEEAFMLLFWLEPMDIDAVWIDESSLAECSLTSCCCEPVFCSFALRFVAFSALSCSSAKFNWYQNDSNFNITRCENGILSLRSARSRAIASEVFTTLPVSADVACNDDSSLRCAGDDATKQTVSIRGFGNAFWLSQSASV